MNLNDKMKKAHIGNIRKIKYRIFGFSQNKRFEKTRSRRLVEDDHFLTQKMYRGIGGLPNKRFVQVQIIACAFRNPHFMYLFQQRLILTFNRD